MIYGRAVSRDGLAESIMRAHGFTVAQMVKLVRTGLASAPGAAGETLMDIAPHLRRELQHDQPFRRLAGPSSDQQVEIDLLQDVLCDTGRDYELRNRQCEAVVVGSCKRYGLHSERLGCLERPYPSWMGLHEQGNRG
jgi:hypothetical protein